MNAVESRREARCRNFERWSDPLPPRKRIDTHSGQREAREKLGEWVEIIGAQNGTWPTTTGYYVFGPTGTGKTFIAAVSADTLRRYKVPVLYIKAKHVLDHLRRVKEPEHVRLWRERLSTADVLILDDIGAHGSTAYAIEELLDVVDHRATFSLPTLFTSNLDGKALFAEMGERLADRITGLCEAIEVGGESLR